MLAVGGMLHSHAWVLLGTTLLRTQHGQAQRSLYLAGLYVGGAPASYLLHLHP